MKKRTILIILSIIELLSLIIFIATFSFALEKTIDLVIGGLLHSRNVTISNSDRFLLTINDITPYIFLGILIIRFILVDKKIKILLASNIVIIALGLLIAYLNISILYPVAIILLIIALLIYLYSHKIDLKDNILLKDTFKKVVK